jgi:hypothetical protein
MASACDYSPANRHDWGTRFPLIVQAVSALKVRSCLIKGEAIAYDAGGLASFDLLRGRWHNRLAALCRPQSSRARRVFGVYGDARVNLMRHCRDRLGLSFLVVEGFAPASKWPVTQITSASD